MLVRREKYDFPRSGWTSRPKGRNAGFAFVVAAGAAVALVSYWLGYLHGVSVESGKVVEAATAGMAGSGPGGRKPDRKSELQYGDPLHDPGRKSALQYGGRLDDTER